MSEILSRVEDLLGFHEGSAKPQHHGGHPVVWINGEDFDEILRGVRAMQKTYPVFLGAVESVIEATNAYLPPDGISAQECINRILGATDNAEIVAALTNPDSGNG